MINNKDKFNPFGDAKGWGVYSPDYQPAPKKKTVGLGTGCVIGVGVFALVGFIFGSLSSISSSPASEDEPAYTSPPPTVTTSAPVESSAMIAEDSAVDLTEDTPVTATEKTTTPDETITEETTATEISLAIPSEVSDFSWTGSTDDVLSGLHVEGYAALELSYSGEGIFSVETHGADDRLLSIALGPYTGTVLIDKTGDYDIEIKADGPWEISAHEIEQHNDGYLHPGDTISGHGDYVSKAFIPLAHKYQVFYTGKDLFSAELHDVSFSDRDLLVMEAGSYTGTVYSELWGICFLEIKSDGDWTIELLE